VTVEASAWNDRVYDDVAAGRIDTALSAEAPPPALETEVLGLPAPGYSPSPAFDPVLAGRPQRHAVLARQENGRLEELAGLTRGRARRGAADQTGARKTLRAATSSSASSAAPTASARCTSSRQA
jgi:hypothetical protein